MAPRSSTCCFCPPRLIRLAKQAFGEVVSGGGGDDGGGGCGGGGGVLAPLEISHMENFDRFSPRNVGTHTVARSAY